MARMARISMRFSRPAGYNRLRVSHGSNEEGREIPVKKTWVLCLASAVLVLSGCGRDGRMMGRDGISGGTVDNGGYASGDSIGGYTSGYADDSSTSGYNGIDGYNSANNYDGANGYNGSYSDRGGDTLMEDAGDALRRGADDVRDALDNAGDALRNTVDNSRTGAAAR